jgi:hypothetical protein
MSSQDIWGCHIAQVDWLQRSWFCVNWNNRIDELVTGMGPGYSGSGIIQESDEGATGSSSLFRLESNVGSGMLSRSHRLIAAS